MPLTTLRSERRPGGTVLAMSPNGESSDGERLGIELPRREGDETHSESLGGDIYESANFKEEESALVDNIADFGGVRGVPCV